MFVSVFFGLHHFLGKNFLLEQEKNGKGNHVPDRKRLEEVCLSQSRSNLRHK